MIITERVRESKAFYAAAGAGDFAVEKLREVPERLTRPLQGRDPKDLVNEMGTRASEFFDELAERGRRIVGRIERQETTQELEARARTTARHTRQAATSARRTTRAAGKAVGEAAKKVGD